MKGEAHIVTVPTGTGLSLEQLQKSYDTEVKIFLKEKQILAVILKNCVPEFSSCSLQDIEEKYITGIPQMASVAVDQDADLPAVEPVTNGEKIIGDANEDKSRNEGLVTYDIRFTAAAPGSGKLIKLIINVEAQRETEKTGYPIIMRGLYYGARLISAQKNVEFKNSEYQNIKKVYSIWICKNVPVNRENSIISYDIAEHVLSGKSGLKPEKREHYDLLSVMLLNLGDPYDQNGNTAVRMLSAALSDGINVKEKKRILSEDFGIRMTETVEGSVMNMCNLSYGIYEKGESVGIAIGEERGIAIGEERGIAIGEERGIIIGETNRQIRIARNMIRRGRDTDEEIAEATELSIEQVAELRSQENGA